MRVIALEGDPHKGKTTTLKKLVEMFCIISTPKIKNEVVCIIKAKFKMKNKIKNKIIGIVSLGDSTRDIRAGFNKIKKCKCKIDVFVCACHPGNINGKKFLQSISKNVVFVKKTISVNKNNNQSINIKDAKKLYNMLKK